MTIEEIKQRFPNPMAVGATRDSNMFQYCIGGAICKAAAYRSKDFRSAYFPIASSLRDALRILNPTLSFDTAFDYAESIISANDASRFDDGWTIAGQALSHGQP